MMTPTPFAFSALMPLAPEVFLAIAALLFIVWGVVRGNAGTRELCVFGVVVCLAAASLIFRDVGADGILAWNAQFAVTDFTRLVKIVILTGLGLTFMLAIGATRQTDLDRFEYPILVLLAGIGMLVMVSAHDFLTLYVGLELQSLSLYVLAAFRRDSVRSAEAGLKYFVLGALSSGLLLFGISLVYGFSGTISYQEIATALGAGQAASQGLQLGLVFVLAGLAFKISAVPFHMWTPDVYEGAPTITTGFFAMVPKIAALGAITSLLFGPFASVSAAWSQIIVVLAVASIVWAAFAGLTQTNIKRLLAYSSIGNIGFALLGLLAPEGSGLTAMLVYMTIYMLMTAGTFGVLLALQRDGRTVENIADFAGLSRTNPALAYPLAALMFSLSGVPPLAGFLSKLLIINTIVGQEHYGIAVVAVLASVVAAYYYLKIIKVMFFDEPVAGITIPASISRQAVITLSLAATLLLLIFPSWLLTFAAQAAAVFHP